MVQVIRHISTHEMIGTYLIAELHSSRFRDGSLKALEMLKLDEDLLKHPDYKNEQHNEQRAQVLHLTRGWPDQWLFTNCPSDWVYF